MAIAYISSNDIRINFSNRQNSLGINRSRSKSPLHCHQDYYYYYHHHIIILLYYFLLLYKHFAFTTLTTWPVMDALSHTDMLQVILLL